MIASVSIPELMSKPFQSIRTAGYDLFTADGVYGKATQLIVSVSVHTRASDIYKKLFI